MNTYREKVVSFAAVAVFGLAACAVAQEKPFEPVSGQPGRDTVWVPTPDTLVQKMLDMAQVTPKDYVIDLGSGDGRMVIAAAKRGVPGHGVEYNPDMVTYSQRMAEKAGVSNMAKFVHGDMFEADISKATVLPLFLLPDNLRKLTPNFLSLRPGTRIVVNGFQIPEWEYDATGRADGDCGSWCTAFMYIVPAQASGIWHLPQGTLVLAQRFQKLSGTFVADGKAQPVTDARLLGTQVSFRIGEAQYTGRIDGERMSGDVASSRKTSWQAVRVAPLPGTAEAP